MIRQIQEKDYCSIVAVHHVAAMSLFICLRIFGLRFYTIIQIFHRQKNIKNVWNNKSGLSNC